MPLTEPRSPITIAGEEFPYWREVGTPPARASVLEVTMADSWASVMLGQLGQYIPGLLEDGTAVEWYVSSVQFVQVGVHLVQLIPTARATGGIL